MLTFLLLLPAGVARAQTAAPEPAELDAARGAFYRHDFVEAERVLERVLAGAPSPADAAEAHRSLATLAWRFRADPERGRDHLRRALRQGVQRSKSFGELSRLERAAGAWEAARVASDSAWAAAGSPGDSLRAVVLLSRALTAAADRRLEAGHWIDADLRAHLERARAALSASVLREPGLLEPADQLLIVGLLLDDGATALRGWRSYYASVGDQNGPIPGARRTLESLLPRWDGPRTAGPARTAVIRALTASAMLEAARVLALDPRVSPAPIDDPNVADMVGYTRFLERARASATDYYRAVAAGEGAERQWPFRDTVVVMGRELMAQLSWAQAPPEPDDSPWATDIWDTLRDRFGAEVSWGRVAGVFGLRIGHRVIDDRRTVEQYGHSAEFQLLSLDRMVVDDYQTWAWDGAAATGGYATAERVVQLRPGYADGGIRAWRSLQEADTTETAYNAHDGALEACAFVPGLNERIRRQGLEQLRDSLAAEGLHGSALRSAFLAAYDRAAVETSIFAHEGRHAIDGGLGITDSPELEFRAKLAQVAFARFPRLALGSILSPDIGEPTPHGLANERVLCGVVQWMARHAAEIHGLDTERPLLPQLALLTDHQLRAAFRSQDPLARP
ncbi:MAG: hypothetical protein ACLFRX_10325 [Gemmatimonadota bacterium]